MSVVWLILKIILWTLAVILGLLVVLLVLPVTAELKYSEADGFAAALRVLGLRFGPFPPREKKPRREKPPRQKKQKKQKAPPAPMPEPAPAPPPEETVPRPRQENVPVLPSETQAPPQKAEPLTPPAAQSRPTKAQHRLQKEKKPKPQKQPRPEKTTGTEPEPAESQFRKILNLAVQLTKIAGRAVKMLFAGIWFHDIRVCLPICTGDAAGTAIQVGKIHSAAGAALGILNNFFRLSVKQYEIEPDYTGERRNQAFFSCKITSSLIIMVIVIIWALPKVWETLKSSDLLK